MKVVIVSNTRKIKTKFQIIFKAQGNEIMRMHHYIGKLVRVHTSDKLVAAFFDTYGSSNASRSLDFANSIQQSHCFSSSETFVALRIITFWHLICKKH